MFDKYAKDLKKFGANVEKIFENTAGLCAGKFVEEAIKITNEEGLVDTGNYKRNWFAQADEILPNVWAVKCENPVEYASFIENGHRTRDGKSKVKGRFVGRRAIEETRYYAIQKLDDELDNAYIKKQRSYIKPKDTP